MTTAKLSWLIALVAAAVFFLLFVRPLAGRRGPQYRAKPLLTENELEFFHRLSRALPDFYVFPQIAMSALIEPVAEGKQWRADFGRISQKRIDYGVFTKDKLSLVAIIELDDRTHDSARDAVRDSYTGSAGVSTLRFVSRKKPSQQEIRRAVEALLR